MAAHRGRWRQRGCQGLCGPPADLCAIPCLCLPYGRAVHRQHYLPRSHCSDLRTQTQSLEGACEVAAKEDTLDKCEKWRGGRCALTLLLTDHSTATAGMPRTFQWTSRAQCYHCERCCYGWAPLSADHLVCPQAVVHSYTGDLIQQKGGAGLCVPATEGPRPGMEGTANAVAGKRELDFQMKWAKEGARRQNVAPHAKRHTSTRLSILSEGTGRGQEEAGREG